MLSTFHLLAEGCLRILSLCLILDSHKWPASGHPIPAASQDQDSIPGCLWSGPAPGYVPGEALIDFFRPALHRVPWDCTGLLAWGAGWDLMSILKQNILAWHPKLCCVLHSLGWQEVFSHRQCIRAGETFLPLVQQLAGESTCWGSHCLVCCYSCFSLSAVVTGVAFTVFWCCGVGIRLLAMGWKTWMHW